MPSDGKKDRSGKGGKGGKSGGSKNSASNVWSLVQKANKASKERKGGDTYMLVVGPKQSGKSSLIGAFLQPRKAVEKPKATVALEYTYGRRTATGGARKDVAHIWELGGGFKMKELVKVPLTMERVPKFAFCIVVDLSRPGDALEFLIKWMQIAKDRVAECMRKMKQEAAKVADGVMLRAKRRLGKNADLSRVNVCAMPIIVVGTKEDMLLGRHDPAKRKELGRALRYVAHANGASFVTLNHKDSRQLDCFRAILNHYLFQTARPKFPKPNLDRPMAVMAGTDSYELIGLPAGADKREMHGSTNTDPMERGKVQHWRNAVGMHFPSTGAAEEAFREGGRGGGRFGGGQESKAMEGGGEEGKTDGGVGLGSPDQQEVHLEPLVDDMRAQKDAELEKYVKTVEQRQRFRGR